MEPLIFKCSDYATYLELIGKRYLSRRQRVLTYGTWAKRLGYRSPRSVAMVIKKQRLPSTEMIHRLSMWLNHSELEHRYFELLVRLEKNKRSGGSVDEILAQLESLNPKIHGKISLDTKTFSYISEWYYFPIKQLIECPSFREDPRWISTRLRKKVTESEVKHAIETMLRIGVIYRDKKGSLRVNQERVITSTDIPSAPLKCHHRALLERASEAIDEQEVAQREITAVTFRFPAKDISAAKEMIRRFRDQFEKRFESNSAEDVYQLNIQFFEHTQTVGKKGKNNA